MSGKKAIITVQIVDDEHAERIARITGPHSAMAQAIEDRKRRREAGDDPVIVTTGQSVLVVPRAALSQLPGENV